MKKIFLVLVLFACVTSCKKDKALSSAIDFTCTDTISFSAQILPMVQTYCLSCHNTGNSTGYTLIDHTSISNSASAIYSSLLGTYVELMPQGGPQLNDSLIKQFSCWINQGKQNN